MQLFLIKTFPQHRWAQLTLNMRIGTCFHKISCNLSFLSLLCRNCVSLNFIIHLSDIDQKSQKVKCSSAFNVHNICYCCIWDAQPPFFVACPSWIRILKRLLASICTARMSEKKLAKRSKKLHCSLQSEINTKRYSCPGCWWKKTSTGFHGA